MWLGIEYERTDIGTACNQHFSIAQPRRSVKGAIARHVCSCEETFVASSKQDCQGEGIRTEEVSGGPLISVVSSPPARSTLPSWSNAAASQRAWVPPVAVGENVAVAGSNKSPKAVPLTSVPPAKRTLPFFSKVAICPIRAAIMGFVEVNTPARIEKLRFCGSASRHEHLAV